MTTEHLPKRPKSWPCWGKAERAAWHDLERIADELNAELQAIGRAAGPSIDGHLFTVDALVDQKAVATCALLVARLCRYLPHLADLLQFAGGAAMDEERVPTPVADAE